MKFNEKLLAMRKKQGLSQEELGLELQVSNDLEMGGRPVLSGFSKAGPVKRLFWHVSG